VTQYETYDEVVHERFTQAARAWSTCHAVDSISLVTRVIKLMVQTHLSGSLYVTSIRQFVTLCWDLIKGTYSSAVQCQKCVGFHLTRQHVMNLEENVVQV